ncbi:MAG: hypothetical protein R3336_00730 [Phycisphaeraceae bacterium]|nr:hypothetical protein [Phycisphaeraceae bacterium]
MLILMLWIVAGIVAGLLVGSGVLHVISRNPDNGLSRWSSRGLGLDGWICFFCVGPYVAAGVALGTAPAGEGWSAWLKVLFTVGLAMVSQAVALALWIQLHELRFRKYVKGPRLVTQINKSVGTVRNHAAVWWTALAVPLFVLVRLAEYVVYPPLTWIVHLPKYDDREWVSVSRHKFEGLVGHDLIWCLYCDWMTGVWSLGSEMLRNIESFWCPIRFSHAEKCENCRVDFPDVDGGWVPAHATMQELADVHAEHYPGPDGVNGWFDHPVRLTSEGEAIEEKGNPDR